METCAIDIQEPRLTPPCFNLRLISDASTISSSLSSAASGDDPRERREAVTLQVLLKVALRGRVPRGQLNDEARPRRVRRGRHGAPPLFDGEHPRRAHLDDLPRRRGQPPPP